MKVANSVLSSLALVASFAVIPGTIDILSGNSSPGPLLVQACSGHDHQKHHARELEPIDIDDDDDEGSIHCETMEPDDAEIDKVDAMIDGWERRQRKLRSSRSRSRRGGGDGPFRLTDIRDSPVKVVNTVIHLLYDNGGDLQSKFDSKGVTTTEQEMIDTQMDVLNTAFAPGKFHFNLTAITNTTDDYWYSPRIRVLSDSDTFLDYIEEMGSNLRVGGYDTLNIYLNRAIRGGYASTPYNNTNRDAVLLGWGVLPDSWESDYNQGDTLVHEVGHWLGLLHTFHGGCGNGPNDGDRIADTNPEATEGFGCDISANTCNKAKWWDNGPDPVQNYMSYYTDACVNNFTPLQYLRMHKVWHTLRSPDTLMAEIDSEEDSDSRDESDSGDESESSDD